MYFCILKFRTHASKIRGLVINCPTIGSLGHKRIFQILIYVPRGNSSTVINVDRVFAETYGGLRLYTSYRWKEAPRRILFTRFLQKKPATLLHNYRWIYLLGAVLLCNIISSNIYLLRLLFDITQKFPKKEIHFRFRILLLSIIIVLLISTTIQQQE